MYLRFGALGIAALFAAGGVTTAVHATSTHSTLTCLDRHASAIGLSDKQEAILDEGIAKGWSEEKTTAKMHMGAEKAKAESRFEKNGCSGGDTGDSGGNGNGNGSGNGDNGGGGSTDNGGGGGGTTSGGGTGSTGGTTGDNSPGSPSGSPGSMVTHCTNGDSTQHGLVNVGLGNVCGVGVANGVLSNVANGILTSSGHSTGGLLNSITTGHSNGGLLGGLLDLGGLLGL